jgi:hypothetical protein
MANESHAGSRATAQLVLGVLVIAAGVLFLLDNLGFITFRHALSFWPIAFIVGGVSHLASDPERRGRALGFILIAVGVVLMLQRMGFVFLSWQFVWPVLLILSGGAILYRTLFRDHARPALDKDGVGAGNLIDVTAILGGVERRISTQDFRGGDVTAILGGCELDLREASIAGQAVIDVFALCGGVTVRVPADWTVIMDGTPILGGFSQKTATPPDAGKRLIIRGQTVMGGVEVRN